MITLSCKDCSKMYYGVDEHKGKTCPQPTCHGTVQKV